MNRCFEILACIIIHNVPTKKNVDQGVTLMLYHRFYGFMKHNVVQSKNGNVHSIMSSVSEMNGILEYRKKTSCIL